MKTEVIPVRARPAEVKRLQADVAAAKSLADSAKQDVIAERDKLLVEIQDIRQGLAALTERVAKL